MKRTVVWTAHEGYPRTCILTTSQNFTMRKLLDRSGDCQVFIFTVVKSAREHCAKKQENKFQMTKKLILHCNFLNG